MVIYRDWQRSCALVCNFGDKSGRGGRKEARGGKFGKKKADELSVVEFRMDTVTKFESSDF